MFFYSNDPVELQAEIRTQIKKIHQELQKCLMNNKLPERNFVIDDFEKHFSVNYGFVDGIWLSNVCIMQIDDVQYIVYIDDNDVHAIVQFTTHWENEKYHFELYVGRLVTD